VSGAIAFVDVQYGGEGGVAAVVVASTWSDAAAVEEHVVTVARVAPYRPGAFYERELPCLLLVLQRVHAPLATVVVDGYVELDEHGAPGLGAHLHDALGGALAVVGIAKKSYRGSAFATPVVRGGSARPLFVTARGVPVAEAAQHVRAMHGPHRIPTLLARVDHLARGKV
jgi:deoxyribonuclease V